MSGDNTKLSLYIFKAYDLNKDGWLDFDESIVALNVLYEQDLVKMLKLAFKIYDLNGDGKISHNEMKKIIISFLDARGICKQDRTGLNAPSQLARKEIKAFDKNGDNLIDLNEFLDGCLKGSTLLYYYFNLILFKNLYIY